jgi:hypothetical protein
MQPMKHLNDFKCDTCGHVEERFLDSSTTETGCGNCGGVSRKVLSPPNFFDDFRNPRNPNTVKRWAKQREKAIAKERKATEG